MFPGKKGLFETNDLNIHVPEGAAKKDGPSAGIALTTAVASRVSQVTVPPEIAMTGEISLRGKVMPIGGLPEKLMAAQRAGVNTVFIPKDNADDMEDVPLEVREKLEIRTVEYVKDVLRFCGIEP